MKRTLPTALLLVILSIPGATQSTKLPPAQKAIVETERAFAKLSVEQGVRASFIAYFADEGIGFGPHPYKVKETLSNLPASSTRSPVVLNWAPIFGGIADAGDMGWNTGPTLREDTSPEKKPTHHGMFFSVWKKQTDGNWRVVLDLGISTPAAVAPLDAPFQTAPKNTKRPRAANDPEQETASLLKAEQEFLEAAKTASVKQAYASRLTDAARVYRTDAMPFVGKTAIRDWIDNQKMQLSGKPIKVEVASSGDLGYAYGSYELSGSKPEKGYYARVWTRDTQTTWRIVMDVTTPIPSGE